MCKRLVPLLLIVVLLYLSQDGLWSAFVQSQALVDWYLRLHLLLYVKMKLLSSLLLLGWAYWNSMDVKWTSVILGAGVVYQL
jgi:hypothetical protein